METEAGILVILTHAAKEKDEESVGFVDESEGSGKVRNCPANIVTNEFYIFIKFRKIESKLRRNPMMDLCQVLDWKVYPLLNH